MEVLRVIFGLFLLGCSIGLFVGGISFLLACVSLLILAIEKRKKVGTPEVKNEVE